MTKKKRIIIATTVIVLIIAIIVGVVKGCTSNTTLIYNYDSLKKGVVRKTITVSGSLDLNDQELVKSKVSGKVVDVKVDYNQTIKKGQLLVIVDQTKINKDLKNKKMALDNYNMDLDLAKLDLDGKRNLYKDNLISRREMDQVELNYRKMSTKYKQLQEAYRERLKDRRNCYIYSPVSGIVLNKHIKEEQNVGNGSALFLVATDLSKMILTINIDEADIGLINVGQKVNFSVSAFPDKTFYGQVKQVRMNPIHRGGIVTYESVVMCDNSSKLLKPGMTATANILIAEKKNVLRVPNSALLVTPRDIDNPDNKNFLWQNDENAKGGFNAIPAEIGLYGDEYTEIKKTTLKLGAKVLTSIQVKDSLGNKIIK